MLLRRYRIMLLRPNGAQMTNFQIRAWFLPALILPFFALFGSTLLLGKHFHETKTLERTLAVQETTIARQQSDLLAMTRRLRYAQDNYSSIRQLNAKLRVMLQMDEFTDLPPEAQTGGLGEAPLYAMLPFRRLLPIRLHEVSDDLQRELMISEVHQQEIIGALSERKDYFEHMPSIWPAKGRFSSGFGWRASPFTGKRDFHKGVDISGPRGTPIYAPASGVVIFAERFSTYGQVIRIKHSDVIETLYAHLYKIGVKVGQEVTRGELIGYVGNTGRSTAPHLHYEVHVDDKVVNPMHYILN